MSDLDAQNLKTSPETAPAFVSQELSNVLDRTNAAAGRIVDFSDIERSETNVVRYLLRVGNVLRWFRADATEAEIAGYAGIIDALTKKRQEIVEAANDESFHSSETAKAA